MVGLKEICAMLVAGSMGAGSVVAVQHAKPPQAKVKAKPAKAKPARPAPRPVRQAAPPLDCPTVSSLGGGLAELGPIAPMELAPTQGLSLSGQLAGAGGGGGGMLLPPLVGGGASSPAAFPGLPAGGDSLVSGVPQPATWAMMVSGFGLIGLALRRRSGPVGRSGDHLPANVH